MSTIAAHRKGQGTRSIGALMAAGSTTHPRAHSTTPTVTALSSSPQSQFRLPALNSKTPQPPPSHSYGSNHADDVTVRSSNGDASSPTRRTRRQTLFDSRFRGMPEKFVEKPRLPDVTAWQTPEPRKDSVITRMQTHSLVPSPKFTSPKKLSKIEKDRVEAEEAAAAEARFHNLALHRAMTLSQINGAQPLSSHNDEAVEQLAHKLMSFAQLPRLTSNLNTHSVAHSRLAAMPVEGGDFALGELNEFEEAFDEKKAFADFVNKQKPNTLPNMVIKQFRHQICERSELVAMLRADCRLSEVEEAVREVGQRTIVFPQFQQLLTRLLHHDRYSPVESQSLFDFFDNDGDGDLDFRELCNGFVLVLSRDGPAVSVMHRCMTLLHPHSLKDTRLSFMSRFELALMVETIGRVAHVRSSERKQLDDALQNMLGTFGCNRRGQFPLDDVRQFVSKSAIISKAISSFTVPRDPELHKSFLSQFFRTNDAEEGEQAFRLMRSERAGAAHRRRGSAAPPSQVAAPPPLPPPPSVPTTTTAAEVDSPLADPAAAAPAAAGTAGTSASSFGGISESALSVGLRAKNRERMLNERPVEEPGEPTFFTMRGVLYRQLKGQPPVPYWVEGMPRKIKYSGDDKRTRSESPDGDD